jgi:NodT family efflux transporter outer membrane factor (OMF) lipoprotein
MKTISLLMNRRRAVSMAVIAATSLVGCASPGTLPPAMSLLDPAQAGATLQSTQPAQTMPWPSASWWSQWGDAQLDTLVDQALGTQPSLQTAQARVRLAQAAVDAQGATRLPQLNASVDLSDQRFTEKGLIPPPLAGTIHWNNNAQVGASWEIDLFGRQRVALDAAIGQLRAAQADAQATRVLLASNIAAGYFNLARLVEARRLADEGLTQRQQVLTLVRQRISAGLDTTVELRQAEGFAAQASVELEALDESIARARHALAELAGLGPKALDSLAPRLAALRSETLPATLPADLIGRRADLVAQRWRVEAAARDVDVARTQFYPNLNLVAFVGLSSIGLDNFVNAGARTFGIGPALRLPLFDGGRLRANLQGRAADADIAVDAYNTALLRALREVADEVSSLQSLERQQLAQADASAAAEAAYQIAVQRYQAGLGNFLVVLTAQNNVLAQRRAASDLKARHLAAEVALARSLGGGYTAA